MTTERHPPELCDDCGWDHEPYWVFYDENGEYRDDMDEVSALARGWHETVRELRRVMALALVTPPAAAERSGAHENSGQLLVRPDSDGVVALR